MSQGAAGCFGATPDDATARTRKASQERWQTLSHLFHQADTQAAIRDTAWAGYQSITEYVDHYAPVRSKSDAAAARATRLLTSDEPARIKRAAWDALVPA